MAKEKNGQSRDAWNRSALQRDLHSLVVSDHEQSEDGR